MTLAQPRRTRAQSAAVMFAATPGQMQRARELAQQLPQHLGGTATASVLELEHANAHCLTEGNPVVVLLLGGRDTPTGLTGVLDAAELARVPVLMLIDDSGRRRAAIEEVAVERLDAPVETIAACVRGMLSRQSEVERLNRELGVATRFTSGLRGEISRMQEELQLASQVQREFLPRSFPQVGQIRMDAFWRPASYVSGDIYDMMRLDEDHVGVFVGDAVGHGVPAALLTMVICRALPAKETANNTYRIIPPAEALARINDDLIGQRGRTTRFATAVYCVINCRTGVVRLSSAGHPAPVLLRDGAGSELVGEGGGLLGVFDGEKYPETELQLHPGDRLLLYSDGFEQAFPGDPTGARRSRLPSKRYLEEFEALANVATPTEMVQQIGRRVDMQFGSLHQSDDLTLVVIERTAAP
ncbi:MAG: serine/threonine-protein phosphatase [Phycisphaerae bacterium]|nr:serine/threonine-protein phosphatase [Phycisphaerae bacterium]